MTTHTLAAWVHDLSPYLVEVSPGYGLRWYGLSYVAGVAVAYLILRWMADRGMTRIPRERCFDAIITLAIGAVVGGRLGYIAFYEPTLLWSFSSTPPWWGVVQLNRGGMASHGGIIGTIIAAALISRGWKDDSGARVGRCPPLHVMDTMAAIAPLGLGLGRLANFVNGELLGKAVAGPGEPAPAWAVRFPQEHLTGHAPALTAEQDLALTTLIRDVAPQATTWGEGYRAVVEAVQNGVPGIAERLEPMLSARHPSQLYQAFAEGLVLMTVVWIVWRRPRKPGVIGGVWLVTYGVLRIATEHWRLPDDHLATQLVAGLSRGQWLSIAMVVAGFALMAFALSRRNATKLGGWSRAAQPDA